MRALLLTAHGSRVESSNAEIQVLREGLAGRVGARYDEVECAFLELASPSIPDAIDRLVERGATEIVVVPYFLVAGRHVIEDIPRIVARKADEHPTLRIELREYIGSTPRMLDLIADAATRD